ncbi:site-specific recombinase phage integrase family [Azospirillum sp. CAG:260]|nr:site-specific recombinase phage integrase family [Azospirillum sp. CAG:260]
MGIGKRAKILNAKQQTMVLAYLENTRYPLRNEIMFLLSFKAGLRAKEISQLTWSMVCGSERYISDSINLPNNASKGKYSGRIIPIHKDLKKLLTDLKQENTNLSSYIITTERDKKMFAQAIVNFFYLLYKGLNMDGCSSHSGRRTFITQAAKMISQAGGTINDIRQLAGHSSLATTQRYIEYNTEAHKKIIEMI